MINKSNKKYIFISTNERMDDFLKTQKKSTIFAKIEKFDGNFFIYFI